MQSNNITDTLLIERGKARELMLKLMDSMSKDDSKYLIIPLDENCSFITFNKSELNEKLQQFTK